MAIHKITGCLQHYVWGGKDYIPALLQQAKQKDQYYAEWWLGAHPSAPSMLDIEGKTISLRDFIAQHPEVLGEKSRAKFGDELPYLLKILDVAKPLSIQLHPTKQQAEIGFAEENRKAIPLNNPKRTYKDSNHKPEMMIALSDFWLLHGFKTKAKIIETLTTRPSLAGLAEKLQQQDLHAFYAEIMQADQTQLAQWLLPIIQENKTAYENNQLSLDNPDYWVLYSMDAIDIRPEKLDAGLLCFYLFNIVHTKTGEGIFQDAGIPHAYLRGQNIELMACSDNVIRGGLTPKHVDIDELLKVVNCQEIEPTIIPIAPVQASFTYQTPAQDFALENLSYQAGDRICGKTESASILLMMQGKIKTQENTTALLLEQGQAVFLTANTAYQIDALEQGYAVIAKLP